MKLLTLNLNFYGAKHGPWLARRAMIEEILQGARPDVIALQAVARDPAVDGGLDQAAQLARALPEYAHTVFQAASRAEDGSEEGMAFLSRFPILETRVFSLSRQAGHEDSFERAVLRATFDAPGETLHVLNAHFSWVEAQALDNLAEALPLVEELAGPAALVGDFNQPPQGEVARRLREAGLTDAWAQVHEDAPGFSFYEGGSLSRRIDYLWLNAALRSRLREVRLVADGPGEVRPSDHAGVLATFAVPS